jgi:hypothetical protein
LLKTEFGCKSYRVFCISVFLVFQIRSDSELCSGLRSANVLDSEYSPEQLRALLRSTPKTP